MLSVSTKSSKHPCPINVWSELGRVSGRVDSLQGSNAVQLPGLRDEQFLEIFHIPIEPVGEAEPCLVGLEILFGDFQSFVEKAHQLKAA